LFRAGFCPSVACKIAAVVADVVVEPTGMEELMALCHHCPHRRDAAEYSKPWFVAVEAEKFESSYHNYFCCSNATNRFSVLSNDRKLTNSGE
jgi:hypothetical protein